MLLKFVPATIFAVSLSLLSINNSFADDDDDDRDEDGCSVAVLSSVEDEFGPGSADATRCLAKQKKVKVVYNVMRDCRGATDTTCTTTNSGKPFALGNIKNAVNDYENTHGMDNDDFEIVAVVYGAGTRLILDGNTRQGLVEELMAKGVKFYYCQNTARAWGGGPVTLDKMITGVKYVTAGVTALADFQSIGYSVVTPNH